MLTPQMGSSFSRHRSVKFHPSVQNRSTFQLIYHHSELMRPISPANNAPPATCSQPVVMASKSTLTPRVRIAPIVRTSSRLLKAITLCRNHLLGPCVLFFCCITGNISLFPALLVLVISSLIHEITASTLPHATKRLDSLCQRHCRDM
jgi:hypothetical protein